MLPTQVFLGLTSGRIFLLPNLYPNPKAAVSHIHTDTISADVIENPMVGIFLNAEREPSIMPSQTNAKIIVLIFIRGVGLFLNISVIIASSVNATIKLYNGIFHITYGCLPICNMVINTIRMGRNG